MSDIDVMVVPEDSSNRLWALAACDELVLRSGLKRHEVFYQDSGVWMFRVGLYDNWKTWPDALRVAAERMSDTDVTRWADAKAMALSRVQRTFWEIDGPSPYSVDRVKFTLASDTGQALLTYVEAHALLTGSSMVVKGGPLKGAVVPPTKSIAPPEPAWQREYHGTWNKNGADTTPVSVDLSTADESVPAGRMVDFSDLLKRIYPNTGPRPSDAVVEMVTCTLPLDHSQDRPRVAGIPGTFDTVEQALAAAECRASMAAAESFIGGLGHGRVPSKRELDEGRAVMHRLHAAREALKGGK